MYYGDGKAMDIMIMAQPNVNIRMDSELKKQFIASFEGMGMKLDQIFTL